MGRLFAWRLGEESFLLHSSKQFQFDFEIQLAFRYEKTIIFLDRVEKSNYFRREGADVHTDAEISLSQAILGGTIRIQGVYETQTLQVMNNIQIYSG